MKKKKNQESNWIKKEKRNGENQMKKKKKYKHKKRHPIIYNSEGFENPAR